MDVVLQSTLPHQYHGALERLVYFNRRQRDAEGGIVQAIDQFGNLDISSSAEGLRVIVSQHSDAQCLFALIRRKGRESLAAGLIYLRTSPEELVVLHIAVADPYGRSRRLALHLVMKLLRVVRATAHRLRGVARVSMLYKKGRTCRIGGSAGPLATPGLLSASTTVEMEPADVPVAPAAWSADFDADRTHPALAVA